MVRTHRRPIKRNSAWDTCSHRAHVSEAALCRVGPLPVEARKRKDGREDRAPGLDVRAPRHEPRPRADGGAAPDDRVGVVRQPEGPCPAAPGADAGGGSPARFAGRLHAGPLQGTTRREGTTGAVAPPSSGRRGYLARKASAPAGGYDLDPAHRSVAMNLVPCSVVENRELTPGNFLLTLKVPRGFTRPHPGQFVHLRVSTVSEPLLRRPYSLEGFVERGGIRAVRIYYSAVGRGSKALSCQPKGQKLDLIGPLGIGFSPRP